MIRRPHADIFFMERYMLNEVGVQIKLVRSKDALCLMVTAKAKILHVSLIVRKVKLIPSVFLTHSKILQNGIAIYPILRVVCKSFTTP